MKKVFLFCGLGLGASVAFAGGPYEVGQMSIDGNVCRWTSYIKEDCTRAEMQKNVEAMNACLSPRFETDMENCETDTCVRETIREIAMDCCRDAGGEMD